jgi:LuxR family maltose regulon positive regulatory protein
VDLWLAEGRTRPALIWARELLGDEAFEARPDNELAQLAIVRALLWGRSDDELGRLRGLLDHIEERARNDGKRGIQIEVAAMKGIFAQAKGDKPAALEALEVALKVAEPEGYTRLFADLGAPMWSLLQEAKSRGVGQGYVSQLLAAFRPGGPEMGAGTLIPDALTAREMEVLAFVMAGLTNREIGAKLVISPETVKKHTSNIFGKLGVKNRTEAATRARGLNLLE